MDSDEKLEEEKEIRQKKIEEGIIELPSFFLNFEYKEHASTCTRIQCVQQTN